MENNNKESKVVVIVSSNRNRINNEKIAKRHKSISFLSNILINSNIKDNDSSKKEYAWILAVLFILLKF